MTGVLSPVPRLRAGARDPSWTIVTARWGPGLRSTARAVGRRHLSTHAKAQAHSQLIGVFKVSEIQSSSSPSRLYSAGVDARWALAQASWFDPAESSLLIHAPQPVAPGPPPSFDLCCCRQVLRCAAPASRILLLRPLRSSLLLFATQWSNPSGLSIRAGSLAAAFSARYIRVRTVPQRSADHWSLHLFS